jgi:hypothetical protein
MPTPKRPQTDPRLLMTIAFIVIILIPVLAMTFPFGPDWRDVYRRAALDLLHGRNPHDTLQPRFLNPTWILLPILPIAALPMELGGAIFLVASLGSFAYAAYRLGATPIAMGAFILAPPVMHCVLNGNIDWIPLLGVTMPPQIGLFFVTAKPQIGAPIVLFWLVETWRGGGWREVARVFAPVTVALGITILLFGVWFLDWTGQPGQWWNASLFPYSVPVGLSLVYASLRTRDIRFALPAGPCLSPYVLFHSWSAAVIAVVHRQRWAILVSAALWILLLVRAAWPDLW